MCGFIIKKELYLLYGRDNMETVKPFDPKDIVITKKNISLDVIIRRLQNNTLILNPEYQRNEIWDDVKRSRLIESLMLNIPIPLFYVAADENGNWEVVDGLQRLTSIKMFLIDKELKLKKLEFWDKYENCGIDDLPPVISNRIFETEFTFVIIEPGSPEELKYNIFNRINTGGVALKSQEIRNALYNGNGTQFLKKLVNSKEFLQATDYSLKDLRMDAQETILRCLCYIIGDTSEYTENDTQQSFLDRNIQKLNSMKLLDEVEVKFKLGMNRSYELFGKQAFRYISKRKKRGTINKSLFEVWGAILANLDNAYYDLLKVKRNELMADFSELCDNNDFYRAVSRDSWTKKNVEYRFNAIYKLINEVISK